MTGMPKIAKIAFTGNKVPCGKCANKSAYNTKLAPVKNNINKLNCTNRVFTNIALKCGTTIPTKPIGPQKATETPVTTDAIKSDIICVCFTFNPREKALLSGNINKLMLFCLARIIRNTKTVIVAIKSDSFNEDASVFPIVQTMNFFSFSSLLKYCNKLITAVATLLINTPTIKIVVVCLIFVNKSKSNKATAIAPTIAIKETPTVANMHEIPVSKKTATNNPAPEATPKIYGPANAFLKTTCIK